MLIGGDMVLPRISTNVSVWDLEPEADALTLYLDSLDRMRALPEDTLVLPSHGRPFAGLHRRIGQLERHHAERLDEVRAACAERPMSAADIVPIMFRRPLDGHQMTFALGEALAHLNALWLGGELERRRSGGGVLRVRWVSGCVECARCGRPGWCAGRVQENAASSLLVPRRAGAPLTAARRRAREVVRRDRPGVRIHGVRPSPRRHELQAVKSGVEGA